MDRTTTQVEAPVRLADYRPPTFLVPSIHLEFDLDPSRTRVKSRLGLRRNPAASKNDPLILDGHGLTVESLRINGSETAAGVWSHDDNALTIVDVPDELTLEIETIVDPAANLSLTGLYRTSDVYCTQCEAEGFRRITWFPDRPDVLSQYTVTITADRDSNPVMLSNGNLVSSEDLDGNRHRSVWHDPHPKPCYLFALVAGDLGVVEDRFVTRSGRDVTLRVYAEHHNIDQCDFAMESLKKSMRWDEDTYGREYDLDLYMIVAVDDFNMGAMENKGLNVFNSRYVLARPDTATDDDYQGIEGVIGHEYFHNWSGNRVTCRDWFQLSLKEGFTVFRDQEFSADVFSRAKRIDDVNILRTHQFPEDSGPLAHPVRPDSYVEINNFYTMTVYNKGAEVVRMLRNLLGWEKFRAGCDLYFHRFDGQAVTTDDFVAVMEEISGRDLTGFKRWYSQSGTPVVRLRQNYDAENRRLTLELDQHCPPTPGQDSKEPFVIPIAIALFSRDGVKLTSRHQGNAPNTDHVIELSRASQSFVFEDVPEVPVVSLLRGFSAPVRMEGNGEPGDLGILAGCDDDPYVRWDAGQQLARTEVLRLAGKSGNEAQNAISDTFTSAFGATLTATMEDQVFQAQALSLPSELWLSEFMEVIDPVAIHLARQRVRQHLARTFKSALADRYEGLNDNGGYTFDAGSAGRRALRNRCLHYLSALEDDEAIERCLLHYRSADNMTDAMAALACLGGIDCDARVEALEDFYDQWHQQSLVVDKWLRLQAMSDLPGTLNRVKALTEHPAYHKENPNKVRALVGAFCHGNPMHFHAEDGSGYGFLKEQVLLLDPFNPQVAARLVSAFNQWRRYDDARQQLMRGELEKIRMQPGLSRDVTEIVSRSLGL